MLSEKTLEEKEDAVSSQWHACIHNSYRNSRARCATNSAAEPDVCFELLIKIMDLLDVIVKLYFVKSGFFFFGNVSDVRKGKGRSVCVPAAQWAKCGHG